LVELAELELPNEVRVGRGEPPRDFLEDRAAGVATWALSQKPEVRMKILRLRPHRHCQYIGRVVCLVPLVTQGQEVFIVDGLSDALAEPLNGNGLGRQRDFQVNTPESANLVARQQDPTVIVIGRIPYDRSNDPLLIVAPM
jgi:hypothetical protein